MRGEETPFQKGGNLFGGICLASTGRGRSDTRAGLTKLIVEGEEGILLMGNTLIKPKNYKGMRRYSEAVKLKEMGLVWGVTGRRKGGNHPRVGANDKEKRKVVQRESVKKVALRERKTMLSRQPPRKRLGVLQFTNMGLQRPRAW